MEHEKTRAAHTRIKGYDRSPEYVGYDDVETRGKPAIEVSGSKHDNLRHELSEHFVSELFERVEKELKEIKSGNETHRHEIVIALVSADGNERSVKATDEATLLYRIVALQMARSAAIASGKTTHALSGNSLWTMSNINDEIQHVANLVPLPGSFPLYVDGEKFGAVAVYGDSEANNERLALAAARNYHGIESIRVQSYVSYNNKNAHVDSHHHHHHHSHD